MTNPHRRSSEEATGEFAEIEETISSSPIIMPKTLLSKIKLLNMVTGTQKDAVLNQNVIDAFKKGKPLKNQSFESTGSSFKLFGHEIARNTSKGLQVSTAGFPTSKTFDTLRSMGVNVRTQKGITKIGDREIDPTRPDFHLVPKKDISKGKVFFSSPEQREKLKIKNKARGGGEAIRKQREFREKSREQATGNKKTIPNDPTLTQPQDQENVNLITGVKSPIGPNVKAPETHHIFFKNKQPGLSQNTLNAIPLSRKEHTNLHRLNAKLKLIKMAFKFKEDDTDKKVASGIYFYKLSVNGKTEAVKKCLLLK